MGKAETLRTRLGEMLDMIDAHAIATGAKPKAQQRSIDDILMNVR